MGGIVEKYAFMPPLRRRSVVKREDWIWLTNKYGHNFPCVFSPNNLSSKYMIYSHGNAEDIIQLEPWIRQLSKILNVNIIAWEYSGYGESRLSEKDYTTAIAPKESYCYASIQSVYNYLTTERQVAPKDIISFGRSLGSGSATDLAFKNEVGGLILQSPLCSAIRVVKNTGITLPLDIFPNIDKVGKIKCPTLVIHGTSDNVIDVSHGKKLFNGVKHDNKDCLWLEGAGHNDIESDYTNQYITKLQEFILGIEETQLREGSGKL
jgi:fermentation-respiration switch protein FrsA (DUF1100 family)